MRVVHTKQQLRKALKELRSAGGSVGLVPTMGYLHEGHISLIRRARQENDVVVVSVFVNPAQFGPNEDLNAYPRDTQGDLKLMQGEKTDLAFLPRAEELYPDGYATYVELNGRMTQVLCGVSRPGHFRGVATVVTKLFNIVSPDRAYFGQKDAQQVSVIKKMVRDLDFNITIVACPTVREADGLAMSSRNSYLTAAQRAQAPVIARALFEARDRITAGERCSASLVDLIKERITTIDNATLDYVSIIDADDMSDIETIIGPTLIAVAVKLGRTRLIDNIRIEV
ncbi:MAG: pantoate--beta-alanine ligase [Desulfatitalea sp.]|nr:pantoate--beta-alanine ligase [Desulfatitalea sp.]NNK02259.1 pantoate--beta-alanine ligase [Desulfatitalea sp.]